MTVMTPPGRLLPTCSPRWATRRRPERETFGGEIGAIGVALGQPFMPHQREIALVAGEIDQRTGLPAYRRVIVTVPRQHGKTTLFVSWQIHRCTAPRWAHPQRSMFTAQSGKDARDKWLDELYPLIRRSRALKPLIARMAVGMGNEYIQFTNGSMIRLLSTSESSGHSKSIHQAVMDEIWHDTDNRRGQALGPAMMTIQDAQVLVCSTAGTAASVILAKQVAMGRAAAGADTGNGTAYFEYSAPDGWDPLDDDSYFGFMPALCPDPPCRCGGGKWRHTITMDAIRSERDSDMPAADFARAYGNIPDLSAMKLDRVDLSNWPSLADPGSQVPYPVSVAFSVAPDYSSSSVVVAGRRADGRGHCELTDHRPGAAWTVGRVRELADRHDPCVVALNPAGAALAFEKELREHGFAVKPEPGQRRLMLPGAREYAEACGAFQQDVAYGRLRHLGQQPLDDAIAVARTKPLADLWAWSWSRSPGDIGPLEASTLARHGFMTFGVRSAPDPDIF